MEEPILSPSFPSSSFSNSGPPLVEGLANEVLLLFFLIFVALGFLCKSLYHQIAFGPGEVAPAANGPHPTPDQLREQFLADRQANMRPHYQDRQCPICLMDARLAVETNCGHLFCGGCLSTYWTTQHPTRLTAMQCPYCRQPVSILFPQFTAAEITGIVNGANDAGTADDAAGDATVTPQSVTDFINTYNRRFSGQPRPWMDYVYDLPVIMRHLASELFTVGGLAIIFRLRVLFLVLGMVFYVISPLDIIPEAVFGIFGLMDDLLFVFILVIYLSIQYRRVLAARGLHDHVE